MLPDYIFIDYFYPCVKYKIPADAKLDGTEYFIVAESMHFNNYLTLSKNNSFDCHLSFICDNDQKAFYKIVKDCLLLNKTESY